MVTVQAATNNNGTATADCGATSHVVSGGAFAASGNETSSYPSDSAGNPVSVGSTNPRYWTARFTNNDSSSIAFALCVPN
jgi:hypothetical protein